MEWIRCVGKMDKLKKVAGSFLFDDSAVVRHPGLFADIEPLFKVQTNKLTGSYPRLRKKGRTARHHALGEVDGIFGAVRPFPPFMLGEDAS